MKGSSLHFLHTESINVLGLGVSGVGEVRKKHITAEVLDKEYCQVTFTSFLAQVHSTIDNKHNSKKTLHYTPKYHI